MTAPIGPAAVADDLDGEQWHGVPWVIPVATTGRSG